MQPVAPSTAVALVSPYALGEIQSVELLPGGTTQPNYLLRTASGNFVLRIYEKRTPDYVRFEIDLLQQLSAAGFPCQQPVPTAKGAFVSLHASKPVALFRYLEGVHEASHGHHAEVAAFIARMHRLTSTLHIQGEHAREHYGPESCLQISPAGDPATHARFLWLQNEVEHLSLPDTLPTGICHCDLNPGNFLYRRGRLTAILDFDMAARAPLLYDVANLLYWWANPVVDPEHWQLLARELLAAYDAVRPLTADERRHLYDMFKLVFLKGVSWFLHTPAEPSADQKGVSYLNGLGRDTFHQQLRMDL